VGWPIYCSKKHCIDSQRMNQDFEYLKDLLHQKLAGIIGKEDDEYIERLLQENEEVKKLWNKLQSDVGQSTHEYFRQVQPQVWKEIKRTVTRPQRRRIVRRGLVGIAAAVILFVVVWQLLYNRQYNDPVPPNAISLQLANGKIINLSETVDRHIKTSNAVMDAGKDTLRIAELAAKDTNDWHVLRIPNGVTYTLLLPDSSSIHLNVATLLKLSGNFGISNKREVYLEGEGYFIIASNASSPFIVHTSKGNITVLGTIFNVNTYDGSFNTGLVTGKIKVSTKGKEPVILSPGHKAVLDTISNNLNIEKFDQTELSWLGGDYDFTARTLEEIGRMLERVYGIQVVVSSSIKDRTGYAGAINKNKIPIESYMKVMEHADPTVKYELKGDTLYIR
jgi:transmembrane sensor